MKSYPGVLSLRISEGHLFQFLLLLSFTLTLQTQINKLYTQPTQEWVARYQRPSGSSGLPNYLALDKVGNSYVLGSIPVTGSSGGMVLIKYNSTGDTVFTRTYNLGENNACIAAAVVADSIGNVYINAYTGIGSFGPYDITTIKYNPSGVQQWIRVYDSGLDDISTDMVLDKLGNVYIGGLSGNNSLVIKYTSSGDTVWTRNYTEANYGFEVTSLAIDEQNNVIIGGNKVHTTNGGLAYFVIKYDPNAVFQWVRNASINAISILAKVGFDVNGNIFATGKSGGKIFTLKYNTTGFEQWRRVYDGPGPGGDAAFDMGIDKLGNAIVTGESNGMGTGNYDYITIKYSPIGDSIWVNRFNGSGNDNDESYSLALDDSNNIYVTGRSISIDNSWNIVTIKYFSNGIIGWSIDYNNPIANAEDVGNVCKVGLQRSIYITGSSRGIINGPLDYVTFKYSQLVGVSPISTNLPEKFTLEQNYPNPFNPATKIRYHIINNNSGVKLVIFDIAGKDVATLVNEKQNSGTYEVTFEAKNFSSGVYFYRIEAEGPNGNKYVERKKMVLVK